LVVSAPSSARPGWLGAAMIAIYHDDPDTTPRDQLRSDAGLVVPDQAQLPEGIDEQRIPAGRYARTVHVGPYEQLGDTWARFMGEWLPASGFRIDGASYEIYRNDPTKVPKPELVTDLYLSITEG
jgi:AraC family transcriptional regulator